MFRFWKNLSISFLISLSFCMVAVGSSLRAGAAKVDITPQTGLQMYGYAGRKSGATGVLDPLYARVLVLETDQKRLALVILDMGAVFAPAWIDQLRASVKQSSGIDYVLVAATHTHSGADSHKPFPYPALTNREVERLFPGGNVKTFLTRSGRREVLGIK
jgi:predicted neutral ceramidase superfamily lipid hydrolase